MIQDCPEGVIISLHVLPNAPKTEIVGIHNQAIKIKISSPPVDGKANQTIIEFLSKALSISKSKIEIRSGQKSKTKKVFIRDVSSEFVSKLLLQQA